ncbi:aromatase/cyclase [Pseudonocardia endophytica]|uniref:Aromatase n=1 Tax=Pseudonocardia endophytica TaxID=401976 RepID=A0A4R1HLV5_PSEEN|nr:aromatase/cyclase [Pseudonocardia endophytica]TCK22091.1 aromatase [Pseudonocardia endophytica]
MPTTRETEHEVLVDAPPVDVYRIVVDVERWPEIFHPTVHVEVVERETGPDGSARSERIRIWATANGTAKTWTSRRTLDPDARRITFRQEVSQPPVGGMGGAWIVEDAGGGRSRVRLLHDYHAAGDDPADLQWIDQAVDRNSRVELEALRSHLERATSAPELLFTFEDSVEVGGAGRDVYDFINEAQLWDERLPHVAKVSLEEDTPGLQLLAMDTRTKDGSTHTTESVRVCRPHSRIVYKQTRVPPLMTLHTGEWQIADRPGGRVSVTSRHTVRINEEKIADVLGAQAGVGDARDYLRRALGGNSLATLELAQRYAESR